MNTLERKEKLSRKEKKLLAKRDKERKKQEKKEKQQQEKERKEREKKEKQERKEKEKLEKELKEKERKSLKEKEKEIKRQKSRERSKSSEKNKSKKDDKDVLVQNESAGITSSPLRSQTPILRQNSRPNDRSPSPSRSPRSIHRSRSTNKDSPRISRSKSFQERKRDKPKVGQSPTRCNSLTETDLVKPEKDLVKSEKDYGTLKSMPASNKKLKREKTTKFKLKQQESKKRSKDRAKRQRSASAGDIRKLDSENKNKAYHASDESFVTARADSVSNIGETSTTVDDDETAELPDSPVFKYNPETMTVEVGDGQFDIELLEYPHINKDGGPISFVEDPFDYDEDEEDGKVTVPISICLIIITGYIFAGSVLFTLWEDWDYLTGSYFCFITLSTIGFGDIVPGTDMKEWESNEKLVLCALWLAFGLSLLAMCFNLMQEEVKEKCKWVGQKLGLLRDEDEG